MKRLGTAVIGVGHWGRNHVRVLSEIEKAELMAICDLNEERARELGKIYGVPYFTKPEELMKNERIDALIICTSPSSLASVAKMGLEKGKHVFVEKPMAIRSQDALELVRLAEREELNLMVGFIERFNPAVKCLKELLSRGKLGRIASLTSKRLSAWPGRFNIDVVMDLAVHDIDMSRYLLEEEPEVVYARVGRLKLKSLNDFAFITLSFSGDKTALIEVNWLTPGKERELRVTGSEAVATLNYITREVFIRSEGAVERLEVPSAEPLKLELEHFITCVLEGREPLVRGIDGYIALRICELALLSSLSGKAVRVETV